MRSGLLGSADGQISMQLSSCAWMSVIRCGAYDAYFGRQRQRPRGPASKRWHVRPIIILSNVARFQPARMTMAGLVLQKSAAYDYS